ncbi:hypothetical protein GA0074696_5231 [Micromonospora purpureochromogenes]|uniref:Uncharacterized protein n=1 Tax=Micromonospora purpureochromogenes TaxID=47872 RepID=A0A1C5A216_9ACTN|nr:hypothetical protein GA0074696_5231 [Micromonospora purpureochromogenes]
MTSAWHGLSVSACRAVGRMLRIDTTPAEAQAVDPATSCARTPTAQPFRPRGAAWAQKT